jgi:hypothetical protein
MIVGQLEFRPPCVTNHEIQTDSPPTKSRALGLRGLVELMVQRQGVLCGNSAENTEEAVKNNGTEV